jgi:hypothetical protein
MDPRVLRDLVESGINDLLDHDLWEQQEALEKREKQAIELQLRSWALYESSKLKDTVCKWLWELEHRWS